MRARRAAEYTFIILFRRQTRVPFVVHYTRVYIYIYIIRVRCIHYGDDHGCWSVHTPAQARVPREQCMCLCVRVFVCGYIIGKRIIYILLYYTSFNIKIPNNKSAIILYILCVVFTRGGGGAGHRRSSSSVAASIQRASGPDTHTLARAPVQYIRLTMGMRRTGGVRGRNWR